MSPKQKSIGDIKSLLAKVQQHFADQGWKEGDKIPPRRYWAEFLKVPFSKVAEVFAYLEKQEAVTTIARCGIFVGGGSPVNAAVQVADQIEALIAGGGVKAGHALASYTELQRTYNVSPTTISGAMNLLLRRNLVYKKGKKYIVGQKATTDNDFSFRRHVKHVVIVPPSTAYFERILDQTSPFSQILKAFLQELSRFAIDIHTVPLQGMEFDRTLRRGRPDVRKADKQFDADIIAYVYISNSSYPYWKTEDIYSSLMFLEEFNRPVVWLDLDNLHKREKHRIPELFSIVGDCLEASAKALCGHLHKEGHRDIALCIPWYLREFAQPIVNATTAAWSAYGSSCALTVHEGQGPWFFKNVDPDNYSHHKGIPHYAPKPDVVDHMRMHGLSFIRHFLSSRTEWKYIYRREAFLIENTPLCAGLQNTSATCIIAPDGYTARIFRQWFRHLGVNVPRDISLACFGDEDFALTEGITTVERFKSMGYALARLCIGDAPVKVGKDRAAVLNPTVNQRVSSSKPRKGTLKMVFDGEVGL